MARYADMADLKEMIELDRLRGDKMAATLQAQGNREAGRTSLMIGSILAAAGGLVAQCVMGMEGRAKHWTDPKQAGIDALGGLVFAGAGMINARRNIDASPMNFLRARRQQRTADSLGAQIAQAELAISEQETDTH